MRIHPAFIPLLVCATLAACAPTNASAQSGGAYNLEWNTLSGGGQTFATGGAYSLGGTTGQADAGTLAGGAYALAGGFWNSTPTPTTGVEPQPEAIPRVFAVRLAGANPSRGSTALQFDLPSARRVSVALFGVDGRLVRRLIDGERGAGRHTAFWDGRDGEGQQVRSGMYFARIQAGPSQGTLRIVRVH
jgi:hypothetical protein